MLITCPALRINHVKLGTAARDAAGGDGAGALPSPNVPEGCPLRADGTGNPRVWSGWVGETLLGGACPVPRVAAGLEARGRGGGIPGKATLGRGPLLG